MFNTLNLSLHFPKKDQCDICCMFKVSNIEIDVYTKHIEMKTLARNAKSADKILAEKNECYVFIMDVQAVKLCPFLNASALYYKQKLQVHNFTIYNAKTHQCTNFWWNETEGDMSASSFISCIMDYLDKQCKEPIPIIFYSDGCGYQNRNVYLSNALLHYAIKKKVLIEHKYLEKGHTQMECDAVHSLIERKLKNKIISLPSDYCKITMEARTKPSPLEVQYLDFSFFYNFSLNEDLKFTSIRPGKGKNDPTVNEIRCLKYEPDGFIYFKLAHDNEPYQILPARTNKNYNHKAYPKLHSTRLPITLKKFKNLQELKKVLPMDTHIYYDTLPKLESE